MGGVTSLCCSQKVDHPYQVAWSSTTWRNPSPTPWPAISPRSPPSCCSSSSASPCLWAPSPSSALTWARTWWGPSWAQLGELLWNGLSWHNLCQAEGQSLSDFSEFPSELCLPCCFHSPSSRSLLSPWLMSQLKVTSWRGLHGTQRLISWWITVSSAWPTDRLVRLQEWGVEGGEERLPQKGHESSLGLEVQGAIFLIMNCARP